MLQTIDERALANLSRLRVQVQVWSGVASLMIGPAARATIGVKLAFLEADLVLQLDAIRDLLGCLCCCCWRCCPCCALRIYQCKQALSCCAAPNPPKKSGQKALWRQQRATRATSNNMFYATQAELIGIIAARLFGALSERRLIQSGAKFDKLPSALADSRRRVNGCRCFSMGVAKRAQSRQKESQLATLWRAICIAVQLRQATCAGSNMLPPQQQQHQRYC